MREFMMPGLLFLFDNVPLGPLAPWVFGLIIGAKPQRVKKGCPRC